MFSGCENLQLVEMPYIADAINTDTNARGVYDGCNKLTEEKRPFKTS